MRTLESLKHNEVLLSDILGFRKSGTKLLSLLFITTWSAWNRRFYIVAWQHENQYKYFNPNIDTFPHYVIDG